MTCECYIIGVMSSIYINTSFLKDFSFCRKEIHRAMKDLEHQLEVCNSLHDAELNAVLDQRDAFKENIERMTLEIVELEARLLEGAGDAEGSQRRIAALSMENRCLKEETSSLITQLHSLRDTNFKLSSGLEDAVAGCEEARERITELENSLQESQITHHVEKVRFQSTLEQHSKLINFLQERVETLGKKKVWK